MHADDFRTNYLDNKWEDDEWQEERKGKGKKQKKFKSKEPEDDFDDAPRGSKKEKARKKVDKGFYD